MKEPLRDAYGRFPILPTETLIFTSFLNTQTEFILTF